MPRLIRKTKRLTVRPIKATDYAAWKLAHSTMKPKRNKWDRTNRAPQELTPQKFRAFLKSKDKLAKADDCYHFGVFLNATGELIGAMSIMEVMRRLSHSAFFGYGIFNRHWGQGFATEATRATIDIAFRDLKLRRLEAGIEPGNKLSIALARSLGLKKEGLKRSAVFLRNGWVDLLTYSALCEDFGFKFKVKPDPGLR